MVCDIPVLPSTTTRPLLSTNLVTPTVNIHNNINDNTFTFTNNNNNDNDRFGLNNTRQIPSTLREMHQNHPHFDAQVEYYQDFGLNTQNHEQNNNLPMQDVQVSTLRICCLLNKSRSLSTLKTDINTTNNNNNSNNHDDDEKLPKGEYFRAIKVGSIGSTVSLFRGHKYLLVSPYQSPQSQYYKRLTVSTDIAPDNTNIASISRRSRRLIRRSSSITTSSNNHKRRRITTPDNIEYTPSSLTLEEFERKMLDENSQDGKCGLYELIKMENPTRNEIEYLRRSRDMFPLYLLDINDDNNSFKKIQKCTCEITKSKSIVLRELLAKVLEKLTARLKDSDSTLSYTNELVDSWNFMDLLKKATSANEPWLPLKQLFTSSSIEHPKHAKHMDTTFKYFHDHICSEILNVRLNLVAHWKLVDIENGPSENTYGSVSFPLLGVNDILSTLHRPPLCSITISDSSIEPYLIGRIADRKIVEEMERRVQSVQNDISKSSARARMLSAIRDLLKTFSQQRWRSSESVSEQEVLSEESPAHDTNQHSREHSGDVDESSESIPSFIGGGARGLHRTGSFSQSLPTITNELELEESNLQTLRMVHLALKKGYVSIQRICHIEDWTNLFSDNVTLWQKLMKWSIENGQTPSLLQQ